MILKQLFKSDKSQPTPKALFWNDLNIPAKLFFHNLGDDNLSFLTISGDPTPTQLEKAWDQLYDSYFKIKDDRKAKLILKTKTRIAKLHHNILIAKNALDYICIIPTLDKDRKELIKVLKKHLKININPRKDLYEEIQRVLNMQIPAWETNLEIEKHNLEELKKGKKVSFESMIDSISDSKGYAFPEDISLFRFLEAEKREIDKNRERKKQQQKHKKRR